MALGTTNNFGIWIVKEVDEPPVNDTKFRSFKGNVTALKCDSYVSFLGSFNAKFVGIKDTDKDYVREGNTVYVMIGQKLFAKYVILSANYNLDFSVDVTGIVSTGKATLGSGNHLRRLHAEETGKVSYNQENAINIVTDIIDGICDSDIQFPYPRYHTTKLSNESRIQALSRLAEETQEEWAIEHDTNGANPYDGGDEVKFKERVGSAASVYTFNKTSYQSLFYDNESLEKYNHVALKTINRVGKDVTWDIGYYGEAHTNLSTTLDGWLDGEVKEGDTTIDVKAGHGFAGMTDFWIQIGWETILISSVAANVLTVDTSLGSPNENGVKDNHPDGDDVVKLTNSSGTELFWYVDITVDDDTNFDVGDVLQIGGERVLLTSDLGGTSWRIERNNQTMIDSYAQGQGAFVINKGPAPGNFSHNSPAPGSDVENNGLKSLTKNIRLANSDSSARKAVSLMEGKIENADRMTLVPTSAFVIEDNDINIGDTVSIESLESIDFPRGGPYAGNIDMRIMGMALSFPSLKVGLIINKEDIRTYSTESTNLKQTSNALESKYQLIDDKNINSPEAHRGEDVGTQIAYYNSGRFRKIFFEDDQRTEDIDTPNYVGIRTDDSGELFFMDRSGGTQYTLTQLGAAAAGSSKWSESAPNVEPLNDRNVIPKTDSSNDLGSATRIWDTAYSNKIGNSTRTFTFPATSGTAGQVLITDAGNPDVTLSWADAASQWEIFGGELRPTANRNVIPRTDATNTCGSSGNRWLSVYASGSIECDGTVYGNRFRVTPSGGTPGSLRLQDGDSSDEITISSPTVLAGYTLEMPPAQGNANQVLMNDGLGDLSWENLLWEVVGGEVTTKVAYNVIPKTTGTHTSGSIANRWLGVYASGTIDCDGTTYSNNFRVTPNGGTPGELRLQDGDQSDEIGISSPAALTGYDLVMPNAQGGANTVLTNDGSGNLSWAASGGGLWQSAGGGDIEPTSTDVDILPNLAAGASNVGASGTRWDTVYAVDGDYSGDVTCTDLGCRDVQATGDVYINTDGTAGNAYLYFHDGVGPTGAYMRYDNNTDFRFEFNKSIHSTSYIYTDTNIGVSNSGGDGYVYFDSGISYLRWNNGTNEFNFSNDLNLGANDLYCTDIFCNTFTADTLESNGHIFVDRDGNGTTARVYFRGFSEYLVWDNGASRFAFTDDLFVQGNLSKSSGSFLIPHPSKGYEDKELIHGFIEGPEYGLIYRGTNQLESGTITITLPHYFEDLIHEEERTIQLTCKNGWSPIYLDGEIANGQFTIKTTTEGDQDQEFCWQIMGRRKDPHVMDTENKHTDIDGKLIIERDKVIPTEDTT